MLKAVLNFNISLYVKALFPSPLSSPVVARTGVLAVCDVGAILYAADRAAFVRSALACCVTTL